MVGWLLKGAVGIASALGAKTLVAGVVTLAAVASLGLISCMSDTGSDDVSTPPVASCDADPVSNPTGDCDDDDEPNDTDNCRLVANSDQADADGDGVGDLCDDDRDGDGLLNGDDLCPDTNNSNNNDADGDGEGDICDSDRDGDGIANGDDLCPDTNNSDNNDADGDGVGDICDDEPFLTGPAMTCDGDGEGDGEGEGELCDSDGDGILNGVDLCPDTNSPNNNDADGDGVGDICDNDNDGDGILNGDDLCPDNNNSNNNDADGDGEGDICDSDRDGDGILNGDDLCPDTNSPNNNDSDGDGVGDICDNDNDGDGILNGDDLCPNNNNSNNNDADGDGEGDICDSDRDGDGILNGDDLCPDTNSPNNNDFDGDGVGDICDSDSDGDGILNGDDLCPNNNNSNNNDFDEDGVGDICDDDVDGDNVLNAEDADNNNNGLIDINYLEDLNNVRNNLTGVANPANVESLQGGATAATEHCTTASGGAYLCGYELLRDLDFRNSSSYRSGEVLDAWLVRGPGFQEIGNQDVANQIFNGIFEGNGFTISNLIINRSRGLFTGLFSALGPNSVVRNLGLINPDVNGVSIVGVLAGDAQGEIYNCFSKGGEVTTGGTIIGGLIGQLNGASASLSASSSSTRVFGRLNAGGLVGKQIDGSVVASFATGRVTASFRIGGLVGYLSSGEIISSYATGRVDSGDIIGNIIGGIVGLNDSGIVRNSWSTADVFIPVLADDSDPAVGGLIGSSLTVDSPVIFESYWDNETVNLTFTAGPGNGVGLTTAQMQSPTGASFNFDSSCGQVFAYEANRYPRLKKLLSGGDTATCNDDVYSTTELANQ